MFPSAAEVARKQVTHALVGETALIVGIDRQCPVVAGDSVLHQTEIEAGVTAVMPGFGVFRVEFDGTVVAGERFLVAFQRGQRVAAHAMRHRQTGFERDGLIAVGDGFGMVLQHQARGGAVAISLGVGFECEGLADQRDGFGRLLAVPGDDAEHVQGIEVPGLGLHDLQRDLPRRCVFAALQMAGGLT